MVGYHAAWRDVPGDIGCCPFQRVTVVYSLFVVAPIEVVLSWVLVLG